MNDVRISRCGPYLINLRVSEGIACNNEVIRLDSHVGIPAAN